MAGEVGSADSSDGNFASGDLNSDQQSALSDLKDAFSNAQQMATKTREINVRQQAILDADKKMPH